MIEKPAFLEKQIELCDGSVKEYIETLEAMAFMMEAYMVDHESDIAWGINDFAELEGIFKAVHGRKPSK